jgi:transposase
MPIDPLPNDLKAPRTLVSQLSSERDAAIEENRRLIEQNDNPRHLLKKLQNAQFGKKSERLDHDQLQLAMEDLETAAAKQDAEGEKKQAAETPAKPPTEIQKKRRPNRGSLPAHLPRIHVTIEPESTVCSCCQRQMHLICDETSERLDSIPAQHRVVVTHRALAPTVLRHQPRGLGADRRSRSSASRNSMPSRAASGGRAPSSVAPRGRRKPGRGSKA